jgi:hypothetical protein
MPWLAVFKLSIEMLYYLVGIYLSFSNILFTSFEQYNDISLNLLYLSECQHLSVLIFIEFGSQTNAHFLLVPWFQDAKKGVLFIDFPPVLQLQLKRFEYDFMRDTMVKVGSPINTYLYTLLDICSSVCKDVSSVLLFWNFTTTNTLKLRFNWHTH